MERGVSLDELPGALVVEIAARVVSSSQAMSSVRDLANMKLTCKLLHEVARDKRVLRGAAIIDGSRTLGWWLYQGGSWPLVLDCAEAGNPLAACALGMVECFCMTNEKDGKLHLAAAAEEGSIEAMYALGIMHLGEHGSSRDVGVKWLERAAKASGGGAAGLIKSRNMVMQWLRHLWITQGLLQPQPWHCMDDQCGELVGTSKDSWCEEDIESDRHFCSSLCRCIHEFNQFVKRL